MKREQAIFAAGCFWGVQYQLQRAPGVIATSVGYIGGPEENPVYADVKAHRTHHVEAVWVEYDADVVSYEALCRLFFEIHDPAQTDGIGPDIGPQYRSQIFYLDDTQLRTAQQVIELLRSMGHEVNTALRPAQHFWPGEEYHQDYYNKTGESPYCHIRVKKF
jgi:peptide-methionine (S)-S-oxide reductase/peptide methionine sulfoxide reductase msrA/msrB